MAICRILTSASRAAGNLQEYIMKRTPAKRSSLFLLELIIAILFFSLTSAVCVQFFARAHQISRQTQELNAALEKVSGCTEIFLGGGDFADMFGVTLLGEVFPVPALPMMGRVATAGFHL